MEMGRAHEISNADEQQSRERLKEENVTKEFWRSASHLCHEFFGRSQIFTSIKGECRRKRERALESQCNTATLARYFFG
jgi:hypothetical protein